jgi:phospho-N-acetylmuramoyl-pentapeptide-transferase
MLLSLAQWLQALSPDYGYLRVFQYLTFRAVMAAMTALLIGLIAGPKVILKLAELKIGQPIRGYGVEAHLAKSGTPTMGVIDIAVNRIVNTVVGRFIQPLCLDCVAGDLGFWCYRMGRRLAQSCP